MKDGQFYVLSRWQVDDTVRQVSGEGERFDLARETMGSGSVTFALAVITGISAAVAAAGRRWA